MLNTGTAAAVLCQIQDESSSLSEDCYSRYILQVMFIPRGMKCSKQDWKEMLRVLSLFPTTEDIKQGENNIIIKQKVLIKHPTACLRQKQTWHTVLATGLYPRLVLNSFSIKYF